MYHLQTSRRLYRPWPPSPRGGVHLRRNNTEIGEEQKTLMTNHTIIHLLGPPTEIKQWNTHCYNDVTSLIYKTAVESRRYYTRHAVWTATHELISPQTWDGGRHRWRKNLMQSLKKKKKKLNPESYQRDERHLWCMRETLTSSPQGIPACSSSWSAR